MSITSNVQLKGLVEIQLRDRSGRVVATHEFPNRIVDYGLDLMSRLMVSIFINDAQLPTATQPVQSIAVGTGTNASTVDFKATALDVEWNRQRLEEVEVLRSVLDIADEGNTQTMLQLSSRIFGAYGNRIKANVLPGDQTNAYRLEITDENDPMWNGSAWVANANPTARPTYESESLAGLIALFDADPTVRATAPNLELSDPLETGISYLSGGGGGVRVSATFQNSDPSPVALTEAALFTSDDDQNPGLMFNKVRFPPINVTNDLDVTFRWKLIFQEAQAS